MGEIVVIGDQFEGAPVVWILSLCDKLWRGVGRLRVSGSRGEERISGERVGGETPFCDN